jgi:hypothetical protein
MCNLKNLMGPRYVQTAAEKRRGLGAFLCVVLGPNSGLTMCKTHFIKLYIPPLFSHCLNRRGNGAEDDLRCQSIEVAS